MTEFSGCIWGEYPKKIKESKKKSLFTPKDVGIIINKLKNWTNRTSCEEKLLTICYEWLKDYDRRKC